MMYRRDDFEQAVRWVADGDIQVAPLITRHFDFSAYAEDCRFLDTEGDKAMKFMMDVSS